MEIAQDLQYQIKNRTRYVVTVQSNRVRCIVEEALQKLINLSSSYKLILGGR